MRQYGNLQIMKYNTNKPIIETGLKELTTQIARVSAIDKEMEKREEKTGRSLSTNRDAVLDEMQPILLLIDATEDLVTQTKSQIKRMKYRSNSDQVVDIDRWKHQLDTLKGDARDIIASQGRAHQEEKPKHTIPESPTLQLVERSIQTLNDTLNTLPKDIRPSVPAMLAKRATEMQNTLQKINPDMGESKLKEQLTGDLEKIIQKCKSASTGGSLQLLPKTSKVIVRHPHP